MYHYDTLQFRECQEGSMDYKMSKFDIDRIACLMYRDIAAYMPDFQLLCGGFPCQTFSIAGSRKGFGDPRGTLFFELARLAEARKPSYLLFENVPGLLSHDGGRTFATILNTLDRLGYGVEWQCLNSKDFGVPQSRNRVYIVGYLDERCLTALDESKAKHPLCWNGSSSMESKCGVPTRGNRKSRHTAIS